MNLLDTDAVIEQLKDTQYEPGYITVVTLIEVLRGIEEQKRNVIKKLLEESYNLLTLDNKVITTYCTLYQTLREKGETLPDVDLLIAASAISNKLNLKTRDNHFNKLKPFGLQTT